MRIGLAPNGKDPWTNIETLKIGLRSGLCFGDLRLRLAT
jgi:hypothetical protein